MARLFYHKPLFAILGIFIIFNCKMNAVVRWVQKLKKFYMKQLEILILHYSQLVIDNN